MTLTPDLWSEKNRAEKGKFAGDNGWNVIARWGATRACIRYAETATLANLSVRIPRAIFPSFHG